MVFIFEAGNTKVSVGSSRAKYADDSFRDKVDRFVNGVKQLAKELEKPTEQDLL
jgi:hypothetical protein